MSEKYGLLGLVACLGMVMNACDVDDDPDPLEGDRASDSCEDTHPDCSHWADIGECDANPDWMRPNCPASCGECVEQDDERPEEDDDGEKPGQDDERPGCQGGKVVHFVYFVEQDAQYSATDYANIENQAYDFQQYWYEQLGVTFYLSDPVVDVIEADHDSAWYVETPDGIHGDSRWYRLGNIKNEVYQKLGISDFDPDHRVVNYPTKRYDGRVGGNFGGAWMDGDDLSCLPDGVNYPFGDSSAHCMGHVVHEFGHVLGLPHTGPSTDCMRHGFYNSTGGSGMCSFSSDNVSDILHDDDNEGWFEALPGEICKGA